MSGPGTNYNNKRLKSDNSTFELIHRHRLRSHYIVQVNKITQFIRLHQAIKYTTCKMMTQLTLLVIRHHKLLNIQLYHFPLIMCNGQGASRGTIQLRHGFNSPMLGMTNANVIFYMPLTMHTIASRGRTTIHWNTLFATKHGSAQAITRSIQTTNRIIHITYGNHI